MPNLATKDTFTTTDVARICGVSPLTVSRWFDSGLLRGWCVPGSLDRRIPREQLERFLKRHDMPTLDSLIANAEPVRSQPKALPAGRLPVQPSHPAQGSDFSEFATAGTLTGSAGPGGPVARDGSHAPRTALFVIRREFEGFEERLTINEAASRIAMFETGRRSSKHVAYRLAFRSAIQRLRDGEKVVTMGVIYWLEDQQVRDEVDRIYEAAEIGGGD